MSESYPRIEQLVLDESEVAALWKSGRAEPLASVIETADEIQAKHNLVFRELNPGIESYVPLTIHLSESVVFPMVILEPNKEAHNGVIFMVDSGQRTAYTLHSIKQVFEFKDEQVDWATPSAVLE